MRHLDQKVGLDLVRAPVTTALLALSAPVALGMVSTFLFQVVDTYFVGKLGGAALAALSFGGTAFFLLVGLFMGMSVGVSAVVGSAVGRGDLPAARRSTTLALLIGVLGSIAVGAAGIATLRPTFLLLGADADLVGLIEQYMGGLYLGFPLLTFSVVGSAAIRAIGRVGLPEIAFAIAGIVNAGLDYALIFGAGPFPELGFQGAALATVVSWGFLFVAIFALLVNSRLFAVPVSNTTRAEIVEIGRLSVPAIATQVLLPVTAMFLVFLASKHGPEVVAAMGIATRVEGLLLVGIAGVTVGIVPFAATNLGAGRKDRIDEAVAFSGRAATYWGGGVFVVLVALADPIARVFSDNATIVELTKTYFYVVAITYGAHGLVMMTAAIFNGIQMPKDALRLLLVKTLGITVPAALVGRWFGAEGIFVAVAVANIIGALYAGFLMRRRLAGAHFAVAHRSALRDYADDAKRPWRREAEHR